MHIAYNILMGVAILVGIVLSLLIFLTGKGDAMSGGASGVRTTFKGKASFEDQMSRITMILAGSFLVLMIILNVLAHNASFTS